jgi:hypothetical protein
MAAAAAANSQIVFHSDLNFDKARSGLLEEVAAAESSDTADMVAILWGVGGWRLSVDGDGGDD